MTLKERIFEKIGLIDNEESLEEILSLINFQMSSGVLTLSGQEKEAIEKGIVDIEKGNFRSQQEVSRMTEVWFQDRK